MINKTITFKTLKSYYYAVKNKKKGSFLARIYKSDGTVDYRLLQKKGSNLLLGQLTDTDNDSALILNSDFIYQNEIGLNCCDFFEKDIEPRRWKLNRDYVTSPQAFNNILLNAVKSETSYKDLLGYLKHPFVKLILISLGLLFAGLLFLVLNQNQQIVDLSTQIATNKVLS